MRKTGLLLLLGMSAFTWAQEAWISDTLRTGVHDGPSVGAKFIGSLSAGEAVTLIAYSDDGNYAQVQHQDLSGWVSARNVMTTPSIHAQYAQMEANLATIYAENNSLNHSAASSADALTQLQQEINTLREREESARTELLTLQRASSNVVAIDKHNRELQAALVSLEQENVTLRHQNSRLLSQNNKRDMYIGGGLVILGFVLHWLAGLLRVTRRHSRLDDL